MKHLISILFVFVSMSVFGQQKKKDDTTVRDSSIATPMFRVSYAAQVPVGDFANRFGFTNNIGASFVYKTKSNWVFSIGGYYMFGNNVVGKDSLLSNLINSSNIIIGANGEQAFVDISQQGYRLGFQVGKVFPWAAPNPNSGFIFTIGGGFVEHWIRYNAEGDNVPQIRGDYHKGYDRLTNGIFIQEFVGYHFQGSSKLLNFYGGFEFMQGFTGNRRSYDMPTMSVKDEKYNDFLFGFRIGWMMPFYKRNQDKYYYY
jgi:hypothetical protein